ncbi:glycosyltransferase family 4 protein [Myxococcota bacterium]|nr:glycosyltransferase family 4 protein [Myxococcota bacterium]
MRVLVASRRFPPDVRSGTETVVENLWRRFSQHHEARLVAGFRHDPALLPDGARKVDLRGGKKLANYLKLQGAVAAEALRFRPDVVLANSIEVPTRFAPTVTILYDFNFGGGQASSGPLSQAKKAYYRYKTGRMTRGVAISRATRDRVVELGVDPSRIEVIYPGVDTERFRPDPAVTLPAAGGGPIVLAYPSRILAGKGQHVAIEAVKGLPDRLRERVELRIVGAATDPDYLAQLRERARGANVTFHLDVPDIERYYREAHVVLFPTCMEEGFGYTAIEAMACGKPVVFSRWAAVEEATGGIGVPVPQGDVGALVKAILALLKDPERCRELGEAGRRHVVENYSWDAIFTRYETVVREAAGG